MSDGDVTCWWHVLGVVSRNVIDGGIIRGSDSRYPWIWASSRNGVFATPEQMTAWSKRWPGMFRHHNQTASGS